MAALAPVTVLGSALYLGYLASTGTTALGPVLAGRPVPWLVLQLLAAGVVAAAAVTTAKWWRGRRHGRGGAAPTVLAGTVLFLPWRSTGDS